MKYIRCLDNKTNKIVRAYHVGKDNIGYNKDRTLCIGVIGIDLIPKPPVMKRQITKKEVIWHSAPNATDTSSATHGYYRVKRTTHIERLIGENHDGNSALCNNTMGISEDGECFVSIDKVSQNSDYSSACKRCQKIFDSLPE